MADDDYTLDQAREEYHKQPLVAELSKGRSFLEGCPSTSSAATGPNAYIDALPPENWLVSVEVHN